MADRIFIHALIWPLVVMLAASSILSRAGVMLRLPRFAGAILAGFILGPMFVGLYFPAVDRLIFNGGNKEYIELSQEIAKKEQAIQTLKQTGVTEQAIAEQIITFDKEIDRLKLAFEVAQADFNEPIDMLMAAMVFPLMLVRLGLRVTGGEPVAHTRPLMPMIWLGPMTAMAIAGAFLGWPGVWAAAAISGLTLGWFGLSRTSMRTLSIEALEPLLWCYLAMQIRF